MEKHTYHSHHIIPQHAGGTDDPSNLVELTVAEHAEAHRQLYEQYGRLEDKLAWKGLAGLISKADIHYELLSKARMGENNPMWGKPAANRGIKRPGVGGRKKGTGWSDEERVSKSKMRETKEHKEKMAKVYADEDRNKRIGDAHRGKTGAAAGKTWCNNGTQEKYVDEMPEGWVKGRLTQRLKGMGKGLRWYNDGKIEQRVKIDDAPAGFVAGRLLKKNK